MGHTFPQPVGRLMTASQDFYHWSKGSMLPSPVWPQDNLAHRELLPTMSEWPPPLDPEKNKILNSTLPNYHRYRNIINANCKQLLYTEMVTSRMCKTVLALTWALLFLNSVSKSNPWRMVTAGLPERRPTLIRARRILVSQSWHVWRFV